MSDLLFDLLPRLEKKRLVVIGDVMLDEHIWCDVERISPEAPVPVAKVKNITHVPGGAANVANNIAGMGGHVYLVGLIGVDHSADVLKEKLQEQLISTDWLITAADRPTITKTRIIAHSQQVVRVDKEDNRPIDPIFQSQIIAKIEANIASIDGIILSDYGKGLLSDNLVQSLIQLARHHKKIIAIDPKGKQFDKYKGATLITPNRKEAQEAIGMLLPDERLIQLEGEKLRNKLQLSYLLITRSEEGMSLFIDSEYAHIPTVAREVYDVSGAGDTVIAVMTLALASGLSPQQSAELANIAAGVVVAKVGTVAINRDELRRALVENKQVDHPWQRKIIDSLHCEALMAELHRNGKNIVSTNGTFDILHIGHTRYLAEAKKMGDILVVGVNSDASVKRYKSPDRPINPLADRMEILANLEMIDYVVMFDEDTPNRLLEKIKPTIHVKGGDYDIEKLPETAVVRKYHGEVRTVQFVEGKSTTNVINKMQIKK